MIDATRRSNSFSITSRPTSSTATANAPESGQNDTAAEALNGALQALQNNPILRALMGESGFDDVQGVNGPAKGGVQGVNGAARTGMRGVDGAAQPGVQGLDEAARAGGVELRTVSPVDGMIEFLKRMIASLRASLGKDPQPQSYEGPSSTPAVGATPPSGGARPTTSPTGEANVEPAQASSEAPKNTQNMVSDSPLPDIDPLEKVLQVLEGMLQALQQAKRSQQPAQG